MKNPVTLGYACARNARQFFALSLTLILLSASLPTPHAQTHVKVNLLTPVSKLSSALQQSLTSTDNLIWASSSRQSVRTLIQTNGPVSLALRLAILLAGG